MASRKDILSQIDQEISIQDEELHYLYEAWNSPPGAELDPLYISTHTRRTTYLNLLQLTRHRWRDLDKLMECAKKFSEVEGGNDIANAIAAGYKNWLTFLKRLQ